MLLADFKASNKSKFEKLSKLLRRGYGISISETANKDSLVKLKALLERKISVHKLNGDTLNISAELVENTLMLECVSTLLKEFADTGEQFVVTQEYQGLIDEMSLFIENSVRMGDAFDVAVESAMRMYRSGKFRYPDEAVKGAASHAANAALGTQSFADNTMPSGPGGIGADVVDPGVDPGMDPGMDHEDNAADGEYPMVDDLWSKFVK